MELRQFVAKVEESFANQLTIDPDFSLGEIGFTSLNITELILVCADLFPKFDFNENFIFFENTSLREIFNNLSAA